MTRGIFNWSPEEVVRFLKDNGFSQSHTKGSHMFYVGRYGGKFRQVCVPFHGGRAIKPRTMAGIIAQSGIQKDLWIT